MLRAPPAFAAELSLQLEDVQRQPGSALAGLWCWGGSGDGGSHGQSPPALLSMPGTRTGPATKAVIATFHSHSSRDPTARVLKSLAETLIF